MYLNELLVGYFTTFSFIILANFNVGAQVSGGIH